MDCGRRSGKGGGRIFNLCIAGKGPMQIAKILTADRVLIVTAYHARQKGWAMPENLYQWCAKSVRDIGAAGVHRLYRELQDLYQVLEIKKRMETRLRTRKYSRTPSPPSSRKASENGYRSCGGTNAGRPRQEPAFFPGLSTALTAGPSCTSVPAAPTRTAAKPFRLLQLQEQHRLL